VLRRYAGLARQVWNRALAEQRARHARGEKYASYADMCRWLTIQRGALATAWLGDAPVHTQQQVLKRLDETYKRFFEKRGGFPKFKKFGDEPGLRFPDPKQFELDQVNDRIKLPKLGWLRLRLSQPVAGEMRTHHGEARRRQMVRLHPGRDRSDRRGAGRAAHARHRP
jgi:putative transposase